MQCVEEDMKLVKLCGDDAQNRVEWKIGIRGNRLTPASTEKQTLKRWWWSSVGLLNRFISYLTRWDRLQVIVCQQTKHILFELSLCYASIHVLGHWFDYARTRSQDKPTNLCYSDSDRAGHYIPFKTYQNLFNQLIPTEHLWDDGYIACRNHRALMRRWLHRV